MTQAILLVQDAPTSDPGGGQENAQQAPGFGSMLPMLLVMFAIIYFLLIRPQSKERKKQQAMIDSLKKNDQVLTQAGIIGTIAAIEQEEGLISLKIADNVRIKITRASVARKISKNQEDE